MKKSKIISIVMAIVLIATFSVFTTKTYATEAEPSDKILTTAVEGEEVTTTGEETALPTDENSDEESEEQLDVYEGDLYVFFGEENKSATTYVMDKLVDGNVFIMGNDVKITGQVNGSLFVMATKLTIDEDAAIRSDLYALAQDITMSGYAFDVYAMCNNFDMTKTGIAYRDLKLMANNAHLLGAVGRDVDMGVTNATVYDDEDNNFFVGRNLNYSSGKEIEHLEDITIYGEVKYEKEEETTEENRNVVLDYVMDALKSIVFALVLYAAFIFLTPKFVEKSREYVSTRGLLAAAIGLAFTILIPIVAIILLLTIVGVDLAFLAGFIYVVILMLSTIIVTIALNEFICNKVEKLNSTWKKVLMIIPVSLAIFLIKLIPFVGAIVSIVVFLVGVGIPVLYQFDKRKKEEVKE